MQLHSSKGCRLTIGSYPHFLYDASGGGGKAIIIETNERNIKYLKFCSKTFEIPSMNYKTTKFLGLPLPPGITIKMTMEKLEGTINQESGDINLNFQARFKLKFASFFQFPSLIVKSLLKTGKVNTITYDSVGVPLQKDGKTKLVGVTKIPKTSNSLLNSFLFLPTNALAELQCVLK